MIRRVYSNTGTSYIQEPDQESIFKRDPQLQESGQNLNSSGLNQLQQIKSQNAIHGCLAKYQFTMQHVTSNIGCLKARFALLIHLSGVDRMNTNPDASVHLKRSRFTTLNPVNPSPLQGNPVRMRNLKLHCCSTRTTKPAGLVKPLNRLRL